MKKQTKPIKSTPTKPIATEPLIECANDFFAAFPAVKCRTQLWDLAISYIESPHNDGRDDIEKSNTLLFCKAVDAMLSVLHTYQVNNFKTFG
jgi:hypothetical protein